MASFNELLFMDYKGERFTQPDINEIVAARLAENDDGFHTGNLIRLKLQDEDGLIAECVYLFNDKYFNYLMDVRPSPEDFEYEDYNPRNEDYFEWRRVCRNRAGDSGLIPDEESYDLIMWSPDVCIHTDGDDWTWEMTEINNDSFLLLFDYKGTSLVHDDLEKIAPQLNPFVDPDDEDGIIWYHSKNLIRMYWEDEDFALAHCVFFLSDELVSYLSDTTDEDANSGSYNTLFRGPAGDDTQQWQSFLQLARDLIGPDLIEGKASMELCSPDICIHKDKSGWSWSS
jgi:hypothetical protein